MARLLPTFPAPEGYSYRDKGLFTKYKVLETIGKFRSIVYEEDYNLYVTIQYKWLIFWITDCEQNVLTYSDKKRIKELASERLRKAISIEEKKVAMKELTKTL